ncbi:MAG TPA: NAD(P)H:quinone oxidoreductase [Candidatus Deferrimicrobium sp.]
MPRELVDNLLTSLFLAVNLPGERGILKVEQFGIPVPNRTDTEGEAMKALIVFYSMYGHVYRMAEAVAEGAREVPGAEVTLRRVPETLAAAVLQKMGAIEAQKAFAHVPVCSVEELPSYDAIFFGTPTRFGNMCGQMRQFLDATGQLWSAGALVGKIGSVFASTATQHGGQESTLLSTHITLLHQGMVVVGLPYAFQGQMRIDEITGGSPYGATTIAGTKGERSPSENELAAARFQGKHVASIAAKLVR